MSDTKNANPSVTVITQPFVISYPKLLKPEPYMENGVAKGEPNYSFEAISDPDLLKKWDIIDRETNEIVSGSIEVRLVALAKEKWGDDFDVKAAVLHGGLSWPFKDGSKKFKEQGDKAKHYEGKRFFRGKALAEIKGTPYAPSLYKADENGNVSASDKIERGTEAGKQAIADLFYGGAICTAELNAVAGTTGDNKYVTFYINSVVYETAGKRLGGGGSNIERLRGVRGGKTAYDPTAGEGANELDDEIPF